MPRIFSSSKYQGAWVVTIAALCIWTRVALSGSASEDRKALADAALMSAITLAWGVSIHATGQEDSAKAQASGPASPQVQVNTADQQSVTSQGPAAAAPRPLATPLPIPKLPRPKP